MRKIIWLYPKLEKWMGGTTYVFECSKQLSKNFDIIVICQSSTELVLSEFVKEKIPVVTLNSYSFTDSVFWLTPSLFIRRDVKKIKEIITPESIIISSMFPMNVVAYYFKNKHIQIIYEPFAFFYDSVFLKSFNYFYFVSFMVLAFLYKRLDIKATFGSSKVLTLSNFEASRIKKIYNIDAEVIYEGVDVNFFQPRDFSELEKKYPNVFSLMHSTSFDSFKGTDLILKAMPLLVDKIPNVLLFVTYTRLNENKYKKYLDFIKLKKIENNVIFLGLLPFNELPLYYSFSKFYLEPGKNRSMSLSNKQSLACGTPVIRGNDSSEEIIDGYNGFQINPGSSQELVDKIMGYFSNPEKYYEIKNNARKSITEKFTWEKVVEKIENSFITE